ncbi:MAG: DUF5678 domain-containing protein [Acidobacteriota bacterium]|nr:DUF5678 domain-containing protein [Acidobacteriota bacterium]
MPGANVVRVMEQIAALSREERHELWAVLSSSADRQEVFGEGTSNGTQTKAPSGYDHMPRLKWLADHATDYAGQYVALDGDRLIAHGADPETVFAALRASHPPVPYFCYIPEPESSPLLGANLTV